MEPRTPLEKNLDLPLPWEDRRITREQWEHHRDWLMSNCRGTRPEGWWLYEKDREPPIPYQQARILFEMGELKGGELQQCLGWFRGMYGDALEMDKRTTYWQWDDIPPKLIKQWDRERRRK
jgi:hypothetical protein